MEQGPGGSPTPRAKSFRCRMVRAQPPPLRPRQVSGRAGCGPRSRRTADHRRAAPRVQPARAMLLVWDRSGGRTVRQGGHPSRRALEWSAGGTPAAAKYCQISHPRRLKCEWRY